MEKPNTPELHVIFGGGQIGDRLASNLAERGHRVRVVQRTKRESSGGIERLSGDVRDAAFSGEATRGASVVYDCMNPQYHQWPELLLPLGAAALDAAARAGAKLVALDCLYMYGVPNGPMREDSPRNPCSKKGELRVKLEQQRLEGAQRGNVQLAIGRASDFFGANLPNSLFADRFWQQLLADKAVECPGDPDMPHSYNYADDVARGLATLGAHDAAFGHIWHLPPTHSGSTRELIERVGQTVGHRARIRAIPQLLLQAVGVFVPMMREIAEMTYQWRVPYVIDDSRFRSAFGEAATPVERAVQETAAWGVSTHRRAA